MVAMNPVFLFFASLEGFDKAAFWIAAFTFVILTGFFLDYVMQRQGFGPYVNSILVIVGVWFGLYVRFNYLHPNQIHLNDPMLTIASVLGVTALMMVSLAFLRNRNLVGRPAAPTLRRGSAPRRGPAGSWGAWPFGRPRTPATAPPAAAAESSPARAG